MMARCCRGGKHAFVASNSIARARVARIASLPPYSHGPARAAAQTIGVVFCGAPAIGAALKEACERSSDVSEGTLFKLHKENF